MSGWTRRRFLTAGGALAAAAVGLSTASTDDGSGRPDGVGAASTVDGERETTYPLVTYNDHGGPYESTMPVNVRFDLCGSGLDVSDVEAVLDGDPAWTKLVAEVDPYWPFGAVDRPRVWDGTADALVAPVASYRRITSVLGPTVGYHAYLWPVRVDGASAGVAVSVHTDVGNAYDHVGARYDEAADAFSTPFLDAGWEVRPAAFAYGNDPDQRALWGDTGDRWLRPPPTE